MKNFGALFPFILCFPFVFVFLEILHCIRDDNVGNIEIILAKRNQPLNRMDIVKFKKNILCDENAHQEILQPFQSLISHGALVDKDNSKKNQALLAEVCYGNTEKCKILIDNGATIDKTNPDGRSPLFYAAYVGNI